MSKSVNCVIIYSVILIILFIVFCYLMTIVNPEPLKIERSDDGLNEGEVKLENIIFDEVLLPPVDNALYGLEKADTEPTETQIATKPYRRTPIVIKKSSVKLNFTTQRVRPPVWRPTTESINSTKPSISNTSHIATRTPSTAKPNTEALYTELTETPTTSYTETVKTEATDVFETTEVTEVFEITEVTESNTITTGTPIKGRRRSIEDNKGHTNDSVILHITNDSGQLKIEIQLGFNGLLKSNHGNVRHETESTFSIGIERNDEELFNSNLARNSIIKLLANNTVIIDKFENVKLNDTNTDHHFTGDVSIQETASNIDITTGHLDVTTELATDYGDVFLKLHNEKNNSNVTTMYTEMYALKVLFDNETKSFTNIVNHEEFNISTIKDVIEENVNGTELYATNTEMYDVNNNSTTIEKSYNYQDVITVL